MAWIGITYLAACYAGLAILMCVGEENEGVWAKLKKVLAASSLLRKTPITVVWLLVFLLLGPLLPLFLAYCIWTVRRDAKFWTAFAKQHRDVVMQPIALNQMQAVGRSFIAQHERAIEALGFQLHNTYLYKPEPLLIEARYYLSVDSRTILSMGHIGGEEYYSLTSFLSSGSGVETSVSHHPMETVDINETGRYYAQMFDLKAGADVAAAHAEHQTYLDRLSQDTGERIVVIQRDQLVLAVRYANRRFAATMDLLGKLDATPPDTEWPFGDEIEEVPTAS